MTRRVVAATPEYTLRDQERMKLARHYFAWQARITRRELGRRVIEVGCGVGNFTRHLLDRELIIALDVEASCLAQLQQNLGHPQNLIAQQLDVVDPAFVQLCEHAIDSIVCMNVLEHVQDHQLALRHMAAVLPHGGKAILIVPAFEALYGPIDSLLGHYRRYTKRNFAALASAAAFEVTTLHYMNSIGCLGWWVNSRILKRTAQSETQIRTFDQWIVTPLAWLEDRLEPPFGQSLFAVLTKL